MDETRTSLLRRIADLSDQHSWTEFVQLYEPLLLAYVRKQGLNPSDAQDVAQSIFVTLVRHLPRFKFDRSRGHFRTWLYRLARNAVIDWGRARGRHDRIAQQARESFDEATADSDPEWDRMHHQRILDFAMEKVKERTQAKTWTCFEQHLLQGRPANEVADELGIPVGTVYVHSSRVLARVREQCSLYQEAFGDG